MRSLSFIGFLVLVTINFCYSQNDNKNQLEKGRKIIEQNLLNKYYSNKFIVDNTKGELYKIDSLPNYEIVLVKWENGYFSIGKINSGHAYGEWNTYDKKNRLRKRVMFGGDGDMLLYIQEFDKKGRLITNSSSSVPFN
jgi:hypothetical protein